MIFLARDFEVVYRISMRHRVTSLLSFIKGTPSYVYLNLVGRGGNRYLRFVLVRLFIVVEVVVV